MSFIFWISIICFTQFIKKQPHFISRSHSQFGNLRWRLKLIWDVIFQWHSKSSLFINLNIFYWWMNIFEMINVQTLSLSSRPSFVFYFWILIIANYILLRILSTININTHGRIAFVLITTHLGLVLNMFLIHGNFFIRLIYLTFCILILNHCISLVTKLMSMISNAQILLLINLHQQMFDWCWQNFSHIK